MDHDSDAAKPVISKAIQALLDRHGVPERKRLVVIEAAIGIAYQQVRRRMTGETPWNVDEIKRLASHFGEPAFNLLGALVDDSAGQPATLIFGGGKLACSIWPGLPTAAAQGGGPFVAVPAEHAGEWIVLPRTEAADQEGAHEVRRLVYEAAQPKRVAVIDDDADLAAAIVRFLRQKGLEAISYGSADQLRTALETTSFDGYILEWVLGDDEATAVLPQVRAKTPAGPVIILTGRLDDGAREADIASAMSKYRAQLYEKPTRAFTLYSALEHGFELASRSA